MLGDAGAFTSESDPPAPAGDLKVEIERFVNVEQCVNERAKVDPLVGDALRAIGYDTFLRDACRLLEAAKDKKRETCEKIDSSALRGRCQAWVAMIAQMPDSCPMQFESMLSRGRSASCVAIAAKDPRLCLGEVRLSPRATCEAMASRDEAKCDALLPAERPACKREVARWKPLLGSPLEGLAKLPATRGKLVVHGAETTPDPKTPEVDLTADFAHGAVIVTSRERMHVELGSLFESEGARIAPSPQRRARLGVALLVDATKKATIQKLELDIPGEATIVSPDARCDCKVTTSRVDATRGGEIAVVLEGTLGVGSRAYRIEADVATFTRDVVADQGTGSSRLLPPPHPAVSGGLFVPLGAPRPSSSSSPSPSSSAP